MRISDWSSDVCSSDLRGRVEHVRLRPAIGLGHLRIGYRLSFDKVRREMHQKRRFKFAGMTDTAEPRLLNVAQCVACDRPPGEHRHLRRRMRMPELLDDHPPDGLVAAMTVEKPARTAVRRV